MISDRYWSAVKQFIVKPLQTVALTIDVRFFRDDVKAAVILESIPVPISAEPNIIAQKTRKIVGHMPRMPPVAVKSSSEVLPVEKLIPHHNDSMIAIGLKANWGWRTMMPTAPSIAPINNTNNVLTRSTMRVTVIAGISRVQGVMLKVERTAEVISAGLAIASEWSPNSPTSR